MYSQVGLTQNKKETLLLPAGIGGDSLCAVKACKQRWSCGLVNRQPPRMPALNEPTCPPSCGQHILIHIFEMLNFGIRIHEFGPL